MSPAERLRRLAVAAVTGVVGAFFVATFVAKVWPEAFSSVFFGLAAFWLLGSIQIAYREFHNRDWAVFPDSSRWCAEELPLEFRFITHETMLRDLEPKLGPYSRVGDTGMVRYDLPSGGALFILFDPPLATDSKVRGVQLYRVEDHVPVIAS